MRMTYLIVAMVFGMTVGGYSTYFYTKTQAGPYSVKLEKTKSGNFILTEGRIYELVELESAPLDRKK